MSFRFRAANGNRGAGIGVMEVMRASSKAPAVRVLPALGALALTAVLAGCGMFRITPPTPTPPMACTEIGCESAVTFHLEADLAEEVEYQVRACIVPAGAVAADADCAEARMLVPDRDDIVGDFTERLRLMTSDDTVVLTLPEGDYSGTHSVTLEITGPDGQQVVDLQTETEFERTQPNGPGCPPVCWFAEVFA